MFVGAKHNHNKVQQQWSQWNTRRSNSCMRRPTIDRATVFRSLLFAFRRSWLAEAVLLLLTRHHETDMPFSTIFSGRPPPKPLFLLLPLLFQHSPQLSSLHFSNPQNVGNYKTECFHQCVVNWRAAQIESSCWLSPVIYTSRQKPGVTCIILLLIKTEVILFLPVISKIVGSNGEPAATKYTAEVIVRFPVFEPFYQYTL